MPQRSLLLSVKAAVALLVWAAAVAAILVVMSHRMTSFIAGPLSPGDKFDGEIAAMYVAPRATVTLTALLGFGLGVLLWSSAGVIVMVASRLVCEADRDVHPLRRPWWRRLGRDTVAG
ncbi:hypothetical protein FH975_08460 [Nesterenkonia sp. Hz 6-5]|nr:hypothetical protein [Nesterenkonia haasae]